MPLRLILASVASVAGCGQKERRCDKHSNKVPQAIRTPTYVHMGRKEKLDSLLTSLPSLKCQKWDPVSASNTTGRAPQPSLLPHTGKPQIPVPPFSLQTLNTGSQAQMPSPQVNTDLRSVTLGKQKDYHHQQPQTLVKAKVLPAQKTLQEGRQTCWCLRAQPVLLMARLPKPVVAGHFITPPEAM